MKKFVLVLSCLAVLIPFLIALKFISYLCLLGKKGFSYSEVPISSLGEICREYMENRPQEKIIPKAKLFPYYDEAKDLYGYVDENDAVVIPAKYQDATDFYTLLSGKNEGKSYAVVQKRYKNPDDFLDEDAVYALIDERGKTVLPFKYNKLKLQYADGGNVLIAEGMVKKEKLKFGLHRAGSAGGNGEHALLGFGFYKDDDKYYYIWNMTLNKPIMKKQYSYMDEGWSVENPFEMSPFVILKEDETFLGAFDNSGNLNIYSFIGYYDNGMKHYYYILPSDIQDCLDLSLNKKESK